MENVGQSNIYHFFPITTHLRVEFSICHSPKDIFIIISMSAIIPTLFITLKKFDKVEVNESAFNLVVIFNLP